MVINMETMDDILVSIIIPTYSRNEMLERAILSALAQTHKNLDIIVIDDNSSDSEYRKSTATLMKKFQDSRIQYIQNKKNLGGAGARNEGIKVAKGEYIAFLDDDDEYYPDKIDRQLEVFINNKNDKLALVYCYVEHVNRVGNVDCIVKKKYRGNCLFQSMSDDCIAPTSLWLVRKSALLDVNCFTVVPCKQDSTVLLKLLEKSYEIDFVPKVLCRYTNFVGGVRISLSGKSADGELLYREKCRNNYGRLSKRQQRIVEYAFSKRLYTLYCYRLGGDEEKRQIELKKMFRLRPFITVVYFTKIRLRGLKRRLKNRK